MSQNVKNFPKVIGSGQYSRKTYSKASRLGAAVMTARGTAGQVRKHHRDNLLKWVNEKAINREACTITDPRKLVPFRGKNYSSGVKALMSYLPSTVKDLVALCSQEFETVKEWNGEASTEWIWGNRLFERAKKFGAKGKYANFVLNMQVLQRVTGFNAYGIPLRDCKFAIDSRWVERGGKKEIQFRLVVGRGEPVKVRKNGVDVM